MQSISKQNETAHIAQFVATAMRFQCGKVRVMRHGRAGTLPCSHVARATYYTSAGLSELAAAVQFAPMQFESTVHADTRYLQMRFDARSAQVAREGAATMPAKQVASVVPYALAARMLQARRSAHTVQ